jgi:electron transfer flavoprotein alpha subunit
MKNILVLAEHKEGRLKKATLSAAACAKRVGEALGGLPWHVLVVGHQVDSVAEEASRYCPATVYVVDDEALAHPLAETYTPVVAEVAREMSAAFLCAAASSFSRDLLPRVTGRLGAGMVSEVLDAWAEDETLYFKRPMWAGGLIATVSLSSSTKVATVRATAFEPLEVASTEPAKVVTLPIEVDTSLCKTSFVSLEEHKTDRPELTEARVVVSGGRGMKGEEGVELIGRLADALGAAVGSSRAAVDAGWTPNDWQVGQTGKIVAPDLYIACGISGAIQHLCGMKDSKVIVAINKDPEAPIFSISDYGLVGDIFQAVPELIEELKKPQA